MRPHPDSHEPRTRAALALLLVLLLGSAGAALAAHDHGKGARSLGGAGVPRGPEMLRLEAETLTDRAEGHLEEDAGATGGKAWNLTTYGTIETTIDVPESGVVWFDIRARGWHPAGMWNPHMHLLIDGVQRAEWDVRGAWLTYPQSVPLLAGSHHVAVENFNNYRSPVADRTLVVDWLSMTTPSLEGVPVVPAGGHVVVDAAEIQNSVTGQLERTESARNSTQWLQWGVGCFSHLVKTLASGEHVLDARLRGNVHDDEGSRVQILVDGAVVANADARDEWAQHRASFQLAQPGAHLIEICYDNDEPGRKRNLWLDEFSVTSLGPATTPPPPLAPAAAWPQAHADLSNTRHAPSVIDATSILTARRAWAYEAAGGVTGTPAYADGTLYFGDFAGKLHAVRADDGSRVWSVDHGAGVDSSVALDAARVYVGDMEGWISARERSDGSLAWRVRADPVEGTHQYGSPVLHDGVLYTGVASEQTLIEYEGEQTFRGSVIALRASDGSLLWRTHTQTPEGKGVSVWSTPAIDPERGLLFVGTGNSYGEPVSAHSDAMLALRLADGSIAWSHQATKGDAFDARGGRGPDRDFGASPLLFSAGGRDLVGEGDKGGTFYALDRATGEVVWTAKADFKVEGVPPSQVEGFLGSATIRDGVIYAPTTARSMVHAFDAATGATRWATELNPLPARYGDRMFGASTAADGVVLQGNAFGHLFGLDAETGKVLVNLSAGGAVQGGVSVAGARFFVPHVGKDLWSGKGGVTAFVVDAPAAPGPGGVTPPTQTPAPTPTPTPDPAGPPGGGVEENTGGAIARGVPGWAVVTALAGAALAATRRARR